MSDLIECLRAQAEQQNLIARTAMQTAADLIEEVVEERDTARRLLAAATQMQTETQAKLAKAVEALRVALEGLNWAKAYLSTSGIDSDLVNNADANVYAVLAELEKE